MADLRSGARHPATDAPRRVSVQSSPYGGQVELTDDEAAVDALLPDGVGAALRTNWEAIAEEARRLVFDGDIWPNLLRGSRWQGVRLYLSGSPSAQGGGQREAAWNGKSCEEAPVTCGLLKGTMASEGWGTWTADSSGGAENDEEATFFSLGPSASVPTHIGQHGRVNIHLCLLNCERAFAEAGGRRLPYRAGGLLAFDDGMFHSAQNHDGAEARVVLTLGVLHPRRTSGHGWCADRFPPAARATAAEA